MMCLTYIACMSNTRGMLSLMGGHLGAMTQDNIDTILDRLNEIQAKNDADHDRVDRRLDAIDRNMERLWQSTNEGFIQVNQKLQDQGRQIKQSPQV